MDRHSKLVENWPCRIERWQVRAIREEQDQELLGGVLVNVSRGTISHLSKDDVIPTAMVTRIGVENLVGKTVVYDVADSGRGAKEYVVVGVRKPRPVRG
jgi:hypothetical protein